MHRAIAALSIPSLQVPRRKDSALSFVVPVTARRTADSSQGDAIAQGEVRMAPSAVCRSAMNCKCTAQIRSATTCPRLDRRAQLADMRPSNHTTHTRCAMRCQEVVPSSNIVRRYADRVSGAARNGTGADVTRAYGPACPNASAPCRCVHRRSRLRRRGRG